MSTEYKSEGRVSAEGLVNMLTLRRRGRPVRGAHPREIRCQTQPPTTPGADGPDVATFTWAVQKL
jgi:hypothetical protein